MPIEIIRNDITKIHVDAIVNVVNSSLFSAGGVDGEIYQAAGPELIEEYRNLGDNNIGQSKITKGYKLPAKYVIHTVGPVWQDGESDEENLLVDYYKNTLALAIEYNLESIALPLISSGGFGLPMDKAFKIAISIIADFLLCNEMRVFFLN